MLAILVNKIGSGYASYKKLHKVNNPRRSNKHTFQGAKKIRSSTWGTISTLLSLNVRWARLNFITWRVWNTGFIVEGGGERGWDFFYDKFQTRHKIILGFGSGVKEILKNNNISACQYVDVWRNKSTFKPVPESNSFFLCIYMD